MELFEDDITRAALFPQLFQDPECWSSRCYKPVTQFWLEVADANPTELKRKHQVKDAYHAPPPKLSGVLTPRDLTLIKSYLWKGLMGERVLEIACSLTLYFLFRER